jgi:hypothetical protein
VRTVYRRVRTDSTARVATIESSLCENSGMGILKASQQPNFTP